MTRGGGDGYKLWKSKKSAVTVFLGHRTHTSKAECTSSILNARPCACGFQPRLRCFPPYDHNEFRAHCIGGPTPTTLCNAAHPASISNCNTLMLCWMGISDECEMSTYISRSSGLMCENVTPTHCWCFLHRLHQECGSVMSVLHAECVKRGTPQSVCAGVKC